MLPGNMKMYVPSGTYLNKCILILINQNVVMEGNVGVFIQEIIFSSERE